MTKEEIIEGNKLIAEFMGGELFHPRDNKELIAYKNVGHYKRVFMIENALYHSSWDWLMPVVEKIETMDFGFKICRKVVEIYVDSTKEVIVKQKELNKMRSLYKAVILFIMSNPQPKQK